MTKALTFIDYVKSQPQFVSYSNGKADITDFYSQEFKPEMIVEYFEGWSTYGSGVYRLNEEGDHEQATYTFQDGWADINGEGYPEAKILDQFISDCTRAGIQLNWKEEVSKKFR